MWSNSTGAALHASASREQQQKKRLVPYMTLAAAMGFAVELALFKQY